MAPTASSTSNLYISRPVAMADEVDCAMDCIPSLTRQRSYARRPLHVNNLFSGIRSASRFTRSADGVSDDDPFPARQPGRWARLRVAWRRMLEEKRRMLRSATPTHAPCYDPYTYAQNFDEGFASAEPDNLSRSFSARFAGPLYRG
ncbi:uncharacterized protein LOC122003901 [Zingiber officinale]|uniref:Uncharacterized protein n=1 Tax=Zingiber officinale TaxID=94328 RepID=A0A8J5KMY4_ZINOF|nr:uncharacterized protein LOC122003901 [Zingiber officinale]KAG6490126.1 hypothetical protein ZIOFF_051409 [Zingiber officinale]